MGPGVTAAAGRRRRNKYKKVPRGAAGARVPPHAALGHRPAWHLPLTVSTHGARAAPSAQGARESLLPSPSEEVTLNA